MNITCVPCLQEGEPRTVQETKRVIEEQNKLATLAGAATKIEQSIRDSGVKDPISMPILDSIVRMGIELRKKHDDGTKISAAEALRILEKEITERLKPESKNPLVGMHGMWLYDLTFKNFIIALRC